MSLLLKLYQKYVFCLNTTSLYLYIKKQRFEVKRELWAYLKESLNSTHYESEMEKWHGLPVAMQLFADTGAVRYTNPQLQDEHHHFTSAGIKYLVHSCILYFSNIDLSV